ncbi:hypothetical protein KSP39_PZI009880 [Platanthera zijinensis]|uniref:C2H2-type domain-containing protein n=1 Tax=Platanthera zijinensis TaxID=2320716 RepID=A0AAP0BJA3_9ASPA
MGLSPRSSLFPKMQGKVCLHLTLMAEPFPKLSLRGEVLCTGANINLFLQYECLVDGCGVKLKSDKIRKQHLVDKHKFPASFEFFKKAKPSQQRRQKYAHKKIERTDMDGKVFIFQQKKKQPQRNSHGEGDADGDRMEVEEINALSSAVAKLSTSDTAPSNISFGHRHARAFAFLPRSLRQNAKHQSDVMK